MSDSKPQRRWYQFSLRTLFVLTTLCAIPCVWIAVKKQQARREREVATAIEKLGGQVGLSEPSGPTWLQSLLGEECFRSVHIVYFGSAEVTDGDLEQLQDLSQLQRLFLMWQQVTDVGLKHLHGLSQLQWLYLNGTQITDAGLEHLRAIRVLSG